jgi:hypothetical protein
VFDAKLSRITELSALVLVSLLKRHRDESSVNLARDGQEAVANAEVQSQAPFEEVAQADPGVA